MAFDDRDQNFEKALARHVRANAASAADCPDAETLAAYYDRLLSQDEMIAKKSHIAGCARCQEILSSLEATDAIPVGMEEQENVVTFAAPRAAAAAGPDASFGRADRMSMPASAPAKSSVREIPRRPFYMRWVAPAGAIAAGLLVWISVHEWSANKRATTSVVQVAQNREEKLPELPASKAAEPQVSPALRSEAKTALKEETATVKKADAGDLLGERSEEGRAKLSAPIAD